jgi:hypothetical protein
MKHISQFDFAAVVDAALLAYSNATGEDGFRSMARADEVMLCQSLASMFHALASKDGETITIDGMWGQPITPSNILDVLISPEYKRHAVNAAECLLAVEAAGGTDAYLDKVLPEYGIK